MPFPGSLLDLAESKEIFAARIEAYEKNEAVSGLVDLDYLRRQLAAFPSPEQARREMQNNENPKATPQMIAVAKGLAAAAYIAQHQTGY
jgi:hypothetical protein